MWYHCTVNFPCKCWANHLIFGVFCCELYNSLTSASPLFTDKLYKRVYVHEVLYLERLTDKAEKLCYQNACWRARSPYNSPISKHTKRDKNQHRDVCGFSEVKFLHQRLLLTNFLWRDSLAGILWSGCLGWGQPISTAWPREWRKAVAVVSRRGRRLGTGEGGEGQFWKSKGKATGRRWGDTESGTKTESEREGECWWKRKRGVRGRWEKRSGSERGRRGKWNARE